MLTGDIIVGGAVGIAGTDVLSVAQATRKRQKVGAGRLLVSSFN